MPRASRSEGKRGPAFTSEERGLLVFWGWYQIKGKGGRVRPSGQKGERPPSKVNDRKRGGGRGVFGNSSKRKQTLQSNRPDPEMGSERGKAGCARGKGRSVLRRTTFGGKKGRGKESCRMSDHPKGRDNTRGGRLQVYKITGEAD